MSRRRKRIAQILGYPRRMRFREVEAILRDFGLVSRKSTSSHVFFARADGGRISVPKQGGRWVDEIYLDQVCQLLGLDELDLDDLDARLGIETMGGGWTMTRRSKDNAMTRTLSDYLTLPYRLEITPSEYGGYVVRYPELLGCVTQVETIKDAVPMAREILEGWIEIALEDGAGVPIPRPPESYSGKFIVRMSKSLHRRLSEWAEEEGVSLNHYAVSLLERGDAMARVSRRLDDMAYQLASIHERLQYDFVDMPNQMRKPELQLVVNNTVAA